MCAGMGSFAPPGASSFLSSLKESYQRKPLETTFQDFLSALCPVSNLPHVPRVIGFPVYRCRSKGLCLRSPARRLPRPLAPATVDVFAPTAIPQSLPLEGKVPPKGADEVSPRSGVKPPSPPQRAISRPGASAFFVSDGPISSNSGRNGGKNAGRNCVSALPQRAMPVRCRPRFPSRNRRFPDRCRSPDCASTAFRCRCLLLRQKLFVLPCRRLRNNYIRAQRAHLPIAVLRAAMGAI